MKRKWLMIPLVTGILAAGITGATVLAHNEDGEQESPKTKVATKLAEILGLDDQTVIDALQEATQEVHSERIQHRLDDMVEAGRLTQEQADAYLEWYEARPEGPNLFRKGHRMFRFGGGEGENGRPRHGFGQQESRGQRSGGQDIPGLGDLRSRFGRSFDGQDFRGGDDLRSRFEERFGDRDLPGQGLLPPALAGEAPQAGGTSY
ncbi:MAG: hypothetical protein BZY87_05650 [SAR202 cluster bacterium Io17-Chloro-G6]|nr:MAG: hypothetical protein BZY87_05650 [SAR202 cluster bacterium Io17-Chloro-G6]